MFGLGHSTSIICDQERYQTAVNRSDADFYFEFKQVDVEDNLTTHDNLNITDDELRLIDIEVRFECAMNKVDSADLTPI